MKKWDTPKIEKLSISKTMDYYNHNHKDWCPACRNPKDVCWCGARKSGNVAPTPEEYLGRS